MIHEFAVEPESVYSLENCRLVLDNAGIHKARLIAEYPRDWKKRAVDAVRGYYASVAGSEVKLQSALSRLTGDRVNCKLIRRGRTYNGQNACWLDNALEQHKELPFKAIIAIKVIEGRDYVLSIDDLGEDKPHWEVPTQRICPRNAIVLADCARPLFRVSKELLFVDPHFDPTEERFRSTLREFLAAAYAESKEIVRTEYHTLWPRTRRPSESEYKIEDFKDYAAKLLPNQIPTGMTLTLYVWQKRPKGDVLHARFILTEKGGIGFDYGLDEARGEHEGETTDVRLLDPAVYVERWRGLQKATAEFDLLGEMLIKGQG